jgi:hypothetical protein
MKKLFIAIFGLFTFSACQKDADLKLDNEGGMSVAVEVKNGHLSFQSKQDYQSYYDLPDINSFLLTVRGIELFNGRQNKSIFLNRSASSCIVPDSVIEDNPDFFVTLDVNGVIQIGQWLYRYDYCASKVFVISESNSVDFIKYQYFLDGVEVAGIVGSFPLYVDVIEAVESGYLTMPDSVTVQGNEIFEESLLGGTPLHERFFFNHNTSNTSDQQEMDGKCSYDQFGIYFHFYGKEKYQVPCAFGGYCTSSSGPRDWNVYFSYTYRRKGKSTSNTGSGTLYPPLSGINKLSKTFYDGSRGLKGGYNTNDWDVKNILSNKRIIYRNGSGPIWTLMVNETYPTFAYRNNFAGISHFGINF